MNDKKGKLTHVHIYNGHDVYIQLYNLLYLRVSSFQCGSFSPADSSFTPESPGWLKLRSSSLRLKGLDLSAEAREVQPSSVIRHPESLKTHTHTHNIFLSILSLSV